MNPDSDSEAGTPDDSVHPVSVLALDVYWASKRSPDPRIEQHLASCAVCRDYLDALTKLDEPSHRTLPPKRGKPSGVFWAASAGAIVIAATLVLGRHSWRGDTRYLGVKGTPAVQVIVKREGRASLWDGATAVRTGDAIVLRVACEGYPMVLLFTPGQVSGDWRRLTESECPTDPVTLPFSLVVDDQPGSEDLAVVLARTRLDDAALARAAEGATQSSETWVIRLHFPKEATQP